MKITYGVKIPKHEQVRHPRKLSSSTVALLDFVTSQETSMRLDFATDRDARISATVLRNYISNHIQELKLIRVSKRKKSVLVWKEEC